MTRLSQSAYARRIGKTRQYISKLVADERIPYVRDARGNCLIEVEQADAVLGQGDSVVSGPAPEKPASSMPAASASAGTGGGSASRLQQARIQHTNVRTQRDLMALQQDMGALAIVAEVREAAFEAGQALRDALLALPARNAEELAALSDKRAVQERLTEILREAVEVYRTALERLGEPAGEEDDDGDGGAD